MNRKYIYGAISVMLCLLTLTGCSQIKQTDTDTTPTTQAKVYKQITLSHDGWNTVPQITTLPAGENYTFTITPEKNGVGCMSTIKRAGTTIDQAQLIIANEPIQLTIDNAQPGEYKFVCNGMSMEQGKIVIEA